MFSSLFGQVGQKTDTNEMRSRRQSNRSSNVSADSFEVVDHDQRSTFSSSNGSVLSSNDDHQFHVGEKQGDQTHLNDLGVNEMPTVQENRNFGVQIPSRKSPKRSLSSEEIDQTNEEPESKKRIDESLLESQLESLHLEMADVRGDVDANKSKLSNVNGELHKLRNEVQMTSSRLAQLERRFVGNESLSNGKSATLNSINQATTIPQNLNNLHVTNPFIHVYPDPFTNNILICSAVKIENDRYPIRVCIRQKLETGWDLESAEECQDLKQKIVKLVRFVGPNYTVAAQNNKLMKMIDLEGEKLVGFTTIPSFLNAEIKPIEIVFGADAIALGVLKRKNGTSEKFVITPKFLDLAKEEGRREFKELMNGSLNEELGCEDGSKFGPNTQNVTTVDELNEKMQNCLLTNGGQGNEINAVKTNKPVADDSQKTEFDEDEDWSEIDENESYQGVSLEAQRAIVDQIVRRLRNPNPSLHFSAVQRSRKLLSKTNSQFSVQVFIESGVLYDLVRCLKSEDPQLIAEAAWSLTNIANGTAEQATALVKTGVLPHFVVMLSASCPKLRDHAVWAISNIIGDNKPLRDLCLDLGLITELQPLIERTSQLRANSTLENICWLLTNLTRIPIDRENATGMLPLVRQLFKKNPVANGLFDLLWTLNLLADLHVEVLVKDMETLRLVINVAKKHLDYFGGEHIQQGIRIQYVTMHFLNKIVSYDDVEANVMLMEDGLMKLVNFNIGSRNNMTVNQSVQILQVVCSKSYINVIPFIDENLLERILALRYRNFTAEDSCVTMYALHTLSLIFVKSDRNQIDFLVQNGVFKWMYARLADVYEVNDNVQVCQLLIDFEQMTLKLAEIQMHGKLKQLDSIMFKRIFTENRYGSDFTNMAYRIYSLLDKHH